MKLIDKDALVAEIENRIKRLQNLHKENEEKLDSIQKTAILLCIDECKVILSFLDTLEVKEVDLDKETTHYLLYEHRSPLNEIMHKADLKSEMQYHKDIENAFKDGFELGLSVSNKAHKGE